MNKPGFRERFSYWFDNWMAKGTLALMSLLGIATIVLVLVIGLIAWLLLKVLPDGVNEAGDSPWDLLWLSLIHI